jgi:hypothetical protein
MRHSKVFIALVSASAAILLACGGSPDNGSTPKSPPSIPPGDYLTLVSGNLSGVPGATTVDPKTSVLIGPHSFLQLDAVARTRHLTSDQAAALGLGIGLPWRASSGHELILAHMPATGTGGVHAGLPGYTGDSQSSAKAELVVGSQVRHFPDALAGNETIVASVPTGSPVVLRMTDGGRPQDLDLRTGKRTRSASPLYYPIRSANLHGNGPTTGFNTPSGEAAASIGFNDAALEPYVNGKGWAPKGRAWLIVAAGVSMSSNYAFSPQMSGTTLTLPDGTTVSCHPATDPSVPAGVGYADVDLNFNVPAGTRSGTLDSRLTGVVGDSTGKQVGTPYHIGETHLSFRLKG